ncbi:MAG: HPr family phosphocarrier protein [Chlamydiota bacterium]
MKVERKLTIKTPLGLHIRPATAIVKLLQSVQSVVTFTYRRQTVNAKSIMSILMLAVGRNAKIVVKVEGDDAEGVLDQIQKIIENTEESYVNAE